MVRGRKARERELKAILGGALIFMTIIALGFGFFALRGKAERDNPVLDAKLCPKSGPLSVTVVVLDKTDPISRLTQLDIRKQLEDVASDLPRFGQLYFYIVDGGGRDVITPVFDLCNPGREADVDDLTGSKALVQKRFDEGFEGPLNKTLDQMLTTATSDQSPIMEAVQAASIEAFSGAKKRKLPKRLIIVSDFAQNSPRLSFYGGALDANRAKDQGLLAPLEGVNVDFYAIQRPSASFDPDRLLEAWLQYASDSEGRPDRQLKLTGANP